ncbi:MAG: peptidylprolyl isomerase [Clostridia bacterium]|nr:peptidylprolyl isomerase [Clostridia bacterium]
MELPADASQIESISTEPDGAPVDSLRQVIATVNGEPVLRGEVVRSVEGQLGARILQQILSERVVRQAARKAGIEMDPDRVSYELSRFKLMSGEQWPAVLEQYGMTEQELWNALELSMLLTDLSSVGVEVTEEDARGYYEQNRAQFGEPELVRASHILVGTEEEAREVLRQLKEGADFAALATAKSSDGGSAPSGGDLGFFERGEMVPEFEEAAFSMEPGQISDAVHTDFGWHVILVAERRAPEPVEFEQVRKDIVAMLVKERSVDPKALLADLVSSSEIVVLDPLYQHQ